MTRTSRADLVAVSLILLVTFLFYREALGLFWIHDSPFHLRLLSEYGTRDFLFSADFWRLEKSVFTPLLFLSLEADARVAGPSPSFFHAHQLVAVAGSAVGLYGVLRLWTPVACALAGSLLFLLGPVVAATTPLLMVRHYFEALALGCASVVTFVLALRRESRGWAIASAILFLAALLAKEIVAPIPFLLAIVPERDLRRRLRLLVAPAGALVVYGAWRVALLDQPLSGHGFVHPDGISGLVAALPGKIPSALFGASLPFAAALVPLLALAFLALRPRSLAIGAAGFAAALAPVVPVSFEMQPRLLLASWMVLAGAVAAGWLALAKRPGFRAAAPGLAALTLLAAGAAGRATWGVEIARNQRLSAEARGFLGLEPGDLLRHPETASPTLKELRWIPEPASGPIAAAGWYQDDLFLCSALLSGRTVWQLDPAALGLRDVTRESIAGARAVCESLCREDPLAAQFHWEGGDLHWQLGPYSDGGYSFVLEGGVSRIDVVRRAAFRLGGRDILLRVRYESPEGRVIYSPPLALRGGVPLTWSRSAGQGSSASSECRSG